MVNSMRLIAVVTTWSLSAGGLFYFAHDYEATPGQAADAPARWPAGSVLPGPTDRPKLVMFLHPRCPCSRASLGELGELLARCRGRLDAVTVFDSNAGDPSGSSLWRTAEAIPGVRPVADDGTERRRFDARTSGQVMFYAADGRLLYRGGITGGRGRRGENGGRGAVDALVRDLPAATDSRFTPSHGLVFGCPLAAEPADPARSTTDGVLADPRGVGR